MKITTQSMMFLSVFLMTSPSAYANSGVPGLYQWSVEETSDPMTDAKRVTVGYATEKVMILFQCSRGMLATVLTPVDNMVALEFMSAESSVPVLWRIDKSPNHSENWNSVRNASTSTHFVMSIGDTVPKEAAAGKAEMLVRAHGMDFAFPLAGAAEKITVALRACSKG